MAFHKSIGIMLLLLLFIVNSIEGLVSIIVNTIHREPPLIGLLNEYGAALKSPEFDVLKSFSVDPKFNYDPTAALEKIDQLI